MLVCVLFAYLLNIFAEGLRSGDNNNNNHHHEDSKLKAQSSERRTSCKITTTTTKIKNDFIENYSFGYPLPQK